MAETPLELQAIRRRHGQVASAYTSLTEAEHDRGALIAELDRLLAENQRLQELVEQLQYEERRSGTAFNDWQRRARDVGPAQPRPPASPSDSR